jgi:hypothetical protein
MGCFWYHLTRSKLFGILPTAKIKLLARLARDFNGCHFTGGGAAAAAATSRHATALALALSIFTIHGTVHIIVAKRYIDQS